MSYIYKGEHVPAFIAKYLRELGEEIIPPWTVKSKDGGARLCSPS